MTTVHRVQGHAFQDHQDQAQAVLYLRLGGRGLFFHPRRDRVARNAKGSFDTAQAAAFVKCMENFCSPFICIAVWRRILTTLTATRTAAVALFAIRRPAIAHKLITPTMDAGHGHHPAYPLHIALAPLWARIPYPPRFNHYRRQEQFIKLYH